MRLTLEQFCVANSLYHQYLIDRDLALTIMGIGFESVSLSDGGFWLRFSSHELGGKKIGIQFDRVKKMVEIGYAPFAYYSKEKGDRGKYFGEDCSATLFKKVWKFSMGGFNLDVFLKTLSKIFGGYQELLEGKFNRFYDLIQSNPTFKNLTYFAKNSGFSYPLGKSNTLLMIPAWDDEEEAIELVMIDKTNNNVVRFTIPCHQNDLIVSYLFQYPLW